MPEILKLPQLGQADRKSKVDIRGGRIDAKFDIQRTAKTEFRKQFLLRNNLGCTALELG